MSLKELLDLNMIESVFNIDIAGNKHNYEIEHDVYCAGKEDVPEEYLNYRAAQIYGFDDGLTIVIEKE